MRSVFVSRKIIGGSQSSTRISVVTVVFRWQFMKLSHEHYPALLLFNMCNDSALILMWRERAVSVSGYIETVKS